MREAIQNGLANGGSSSSSAAYRGIRTNAGGWRYGCDSGIAVLTIQSPLGDWMVVSLGRACACSGAHMPGVVLEAYSDPKVRKFRG